MLEPHLNTMLTNKKKNQKLCPLHKATYVKQL